MKDRRDRTPPPASEEIAVRAFELYCEQGCKDGHNVDHWLQAESELNQQQRERQGVAAQGVAE